MQNKHIVIRLKLISSGYLPIDRMYVPAVSENTIQHDRADSIERVLLRLLAQCISIHHPTQKEKK
jgi:hypothetical protein